MKISELIDRLEDFKLVSGEDLEVCIYDDEYDIAHSNIDAGEGVKVYWVDKDGNMLTLTPALSDPGKKEYVMKVVIG